MHMQQATDPTFVIPEGTPVQADDSGSILNDLTLLGTCTVHQYVAPEPGTDEGYYDENGEWVPNGTDEPEEAEDTPSGQETDFLNWLLSTVA